MWEAGSQCTAKARGTSRTDEQYMYWLLIGPGFLLLTLFEIENYPMSPLEGTIIRKLSLCFAYLFIVLIFWSLLLQCSA